LFFARKNLDQKIIESFSYKFSKSTLKSSFTHTFASTNKHNVCCYSTNCLRRWPQSHQGPSTYGLFFAFTVRVRSKMRRNTTQKKRRHHLRSIVVVKERRYFRSFVCAIHSCLPSRDPDLIRTIDDQKKY